MGVWIILSKENAKTIEQQMYVTLPSLILTVDRFIRPVLQTLGKGAGLFPLYVQCRSRRDAEDIQRIHKPLVELFNRFSDAKQLARAIHHALDCSTIMSSVTEWYALLNGCSFRGILNSSVCVQPFTCIILR